MHRFGWLLFGFGALLLLGKGFFLLPLLVLPFLIWPLLGMLLFRGFAHRRGGYPWDGHGRRSYYWRGRHGYYGGSAHGCGEQRRAERPQEPAAKQPSEPRGYTGETTRL